MALNGGIVYKGSLIIYTSTGNGGVYLLMDIPKRQESLRILGSKK